MKNGSFKIDNFSQAKNYINYTSPKKEHNNLNWMISTK